MLKYLVLTSLLFCSTSFAQIKRPTNPVDLETVTVMISDRAKESGGSGVILRSGELGSYILTNAHVCNGLENGGIVTTSQGEYPVERFKMSKIHDICLVNVIANLKYQTIIADSPAKFGQKLRVSGHPYLLPANTVEGYASKNKDITLMIGVEKCNEEDLEKRAMYCFFLGGIPVVKTYNAQTTSLVVAPGNSGSAVFDDSGKIVGLVFAGIGRSLSPGYIVPVQYLKVFLQKEVGTLKWVDANAAKSIRPTSKSLKANTTMLYKLRLRDVAFPTVLAPKYEKISRQIENCKMDTERCNL